MEEGLPSDVITSIVKDNQNFIWIGTTKGLCRWDGFNAIIYKHDDNNSNSLIADAIPRNGLAWDSVRQKLVIAANEGISFLDPYNRTFTNFYIDQINPGSLQASVHAVFIDKQGILWVGTDKGFSHFSYSDYRFKNFLFSGTIPSGVMLEKTAVNRIFDICQDPSNDSVLWMATLAGLLKFDKNSQNIQWFYFEDNNYLREINQFTMIVPDEEGLLYLGTWNFDMVVFDTNTEKFIDRYGTGAKGTHQMPERIMPYLIDQKGKLWISSLNGLGILNTNTGKTTEYLNFKNESGHRFAPELFYRDDNGFLWLGSEYGIYLVEPEDQPVNNYFFNPLDENHWYLTRTMLENPSDQSLIIGYGRGEGLHLFDLATENFTVINYPRRMISEYNISSLIRNSDGLIYFLTPDDIYQYSPIKGKIESLKVKYAQFPEMNDFKMDSKGNLWIASTNLGLIKFNPQSKKLEKIRNWPNEFKTGHDLPSFTEIYIGCSDRIWFRRKGESYGYFDAISNLVNYFNEPGKAFDLTCFGTSIGDSIWVATADNEIGFIDDGHPENGVTILYHTDSMPYGMISSIAIDQKNRLWCLTENGLLQINPKSGEKVLFDENYGIPVRDKWSHKNALVPGRIMLLSDGNMVIGYRRGLGFFNPDSLKIVYSTPTPYLTSFRVFDQEILSKSNRSLVFEYDQNYFSFEYSAHDLYYQGVGLRHKLEGIDPDWQVHQAGHEIFYPNLSPGKYKFQIQANTLTGSGRTSVNAISFTVLPPWWKTVWAYVIFLLLISMILYVFYRFQFNRQLAHREAKRLRELDELKTKLYANITHEFRTPITVIMGLAEELSDAFDTIDKKQFRKKVDTIQRSGGNLLHLVNQMLDLAKLEHGKLNYNPGQQNIIPWLQYMVESHQSLAATKEIQLTFYTETESLVMDFDPDQLMKVITNLLTNAIKFTDKRGKVICHAKHDPAENTFHIKVKDTGIGIPDNEKSRIFDRFYQVESSARHNRSGTGIGLSLTQEIVEMINGSISVKSEPGKGSEFEVVLPVTRNAKEISINVAAIEKPLIQRELSNVEFEEEFSENTIGHEKPLVLIAEDNPDVAGYIRDTIRMQYKIKWASDGEKALQMAFDLIPDLVITDVMMPGKDGFEVCNTLKTDERTDHIPVVMLTAKVTDTDRISGYERGADAYLTKPFNKKELLVRLEQLLKLRKQLQTKFGKLEFKAGQGKQAGPEELFILKAAQIVEANLEKSMFNAADLANEIHLSESQLYRKLKAISGKSTAIFIRTVRLKKAKELLETTNLSVSEIGYQVGFNDPAWFSRVFKEEFGVSPTETRVNLNSSDDFNSSDE
jgi:signal transduction histidine kinase/DNA-binding response OmpR family regulator/ligand-binding sensor domain-containing protein